MKISNKQKVLWNVSLFDVADTPDNMEIRLYTRFESWASIYGQKMFRWHKSHRYLADIYTAVKL